MKKNKLVGFFATIVLSISATSVVAVEVHPLNQSISVYAVIDGKKLPYGGFYKLSDVEQGEIRSSLAAQESEKLKRHYSPKLSNQVVLPVDIADIRLKKIKKGYQDAFDLAHEKGKLPVYLRQHKKAAHFLGLYNQRYLGWHDGKPKSGTTVERAINNEADFDFLSLVLTSDQVDLNQLAYLDKRLSVRDADAVRSWVVKNANESKQLSVLDVLTENQVKSRLALLGN